MWLRGVLEYDDKSAMSANIRSLAVSWGLSLTLGAFLPGVCAAEGAGEVSLTAPWEGSVASPPPAPEVTATRVVGPVCKDGPCSEWMGDFIASFEDLNGKWGDPDVLCLGAEDGWKSGCAGAGDRKLPVRYVTVREGAGNEEALVRKIKIADCSEETTTHECTESLYDLKDTGPASGGCKAGVWDEVLKACVQVSGARIVVSGKDGVEARNGDGGGVTQRLLKSRLRAHAKAQKTIGGEGAGGRQFFVVPEAVEGMLCLQFIPPYGGDVQDELLGCGVILAGEEKDGRVVSRGGVGDSVELGKVNGTDYKLVASSVNVMKGVVSWKVEKGQGPYDNKPTLKLVKRRAAPGRGGGVSPEDLAELLAQQQGGSAGSGAAGENPGPPSPEKAPPWTWCSIAPTWISSPACRPASPRKARRK